MLRTDLESFRDLLRSKEDQLADKSRTLESIAIERSPDLFEEIQYKLNRELAIVGVNRNTAIRRNVELALIRIDEGSFGTCVHCEQAISRRRLEAVPWTPFCIRCQEAADRGAERVLASLEPRFFDAA
jgi:DnaK suppressor protein